MDPEILTLQSNPDLQVIILDPVLQFSLSIFKNDYLILRLPSFEMSFVEHWWNEVFDLLSLPGYKELIVDIRDNTGGIVCLGVNLASLLLQNNEINDLNLHDCRKTPEFEHFPMQDCVRLSTYPNPKNTIPFSQLYTKGSKNYTRGGVGKFPRFLFIFLTFEDAAYTLQYKLNCDASQFSDIDIAFPTEKIHILTSGISVSTASTFVKTIYGKLDIGIIVVSFLCHHLVFSWVWGSL